MLHLIMSSPAISDIRSIELMLSENDDILLLQDAVYGAVARNDYFRRIVEKRDHGMYVLEEDGLARGILPYLNPKFTLINYQQFVEMTVKHTKQITW